MSDRADWGGAPAPPPSPSEPSSSAPLASAELDVTLPDGLRLHVRRAGRGPALLLLHGFTGAATTWTPFLPAFAARHHVVAVDLPGHGRSDAPADPARYAATACADDLAALLDALDIGRAAVLGYSMGGRLALQFTLAHPARVGALILESASPGIADEAERAQRAAADRQLADDIERDGVAAFVARWERLPLWASQAALPGDVRDRLRAQRLANDARGLAGSLRGAGAGVTLPLHDRLHDVRAPTLLVAGTRDEKYARQALATAAAIPGARAVVVRDAGHAVHLERPAEFTRLVLEFLREQAGSMEEA